MSLSDAELNVSEIIYVQVVVIKHGSSPLLVAVAFSFSSFIVNILRVIHVFGLWLQPFQNDYQFRKILPLISL